VPLQIPVLDDRRFADLFLEARSLIPTYAPEWTNHNPTDPGITLIELFAHLTETLMYRLDRVTTANTVAFLNLIDGKVRDADDFEGQDGVLAAEIGATILQLRQLDRAVTASDFEALASNADPRVERARAVPRRNLAFDLTRDKPGHVSVIVLPTAGAQSAADAVVAAVQAYLEPRVLLTTRVHAVGPFFIDVAVQATVVPHADQLDGDVKVKVADTVSAFLDPHAGGIRRRGWPFGRDVYASELFAAIDGLPEVDYVASLSLNPTPPDRIVRRKDGKLIGVSIQPHELVRAHVGPDDITAAAL
jgi:hypothetical protein